MESDVNSLKQRITETRNDIRDAFEFAFDEELQAILISLLGEISTTFMQGKGIAFFGNGGSAAEATHIAAEFTGHCVIDHQPHFAISLNDSNSAITAITNDYGFEEIFRRQIYAMRNSLGVAFGLSTSGQSKNVISGLKEAKKQNMVTVLMTGINAKNLDLPFVDYKLCVESDVTPRIQEVHLAWGHTLAELIEMKNFDYNSSF